MTHALGDATAATLLLAVTAYSTAGGVDFGAGIWDLLAGGGERATRARLLIDHSMAPVWEVNNVWLVLGIVVCWTGFPILFQSVFLALYPLYAFALLGLILRGAFFAFRHVSADSGYRRIADVIFGVSSLLTPFFFAASLGAIASGAVRTSAAATSAWQTSFSPIAVGFGLVSLAATALSGASFLVGDAHREGDAELVGYFQRRAVVAAAALVAVGTIALLVTYAQQPRLVAAMLGLPAVVFTAGTMVLTPAAGFLHLRGILRWYRTVTVAAVACLVLAWGFAQSPYLLPGQLTISDAAAPASTLLLLLIAALVVAFVISPTMALLYYLDQRGMLLPPDAG